MALLFLFMDNWAVKKSRAESNAQGRRSSLTEQVLSRVCRTTSANKLQRSGKTSWIMTCHTPKNSSKKADVCLRPSLTHVHHSFARKEPQSASYVVLNNFPLRTKINPVSMMASFSAKLYYVGRSHLGKHLAVLSACMTDSSCVCSFFITSWLVSLPTREEPETFLCAEPQCSADNI